MVKISFLGDIMCEFPLLNAVKERKGKFDFSECFSGLKPLLEESDLVVGNLETPVAGEEQGYSNAREMYSFNTPGEFADAAAQAGISLFLTANNHCLDSGKEGLIRTIQALDEKGLPHTGTFRSADETRVFYQKIGDVTIAVISCTADLYEGMRDLASAAECVNLIVDKYAVPGQKTNRSFVSKAKRYFVNQVIGLQRYMWIRKKLGKEPQSPTKDRYPISDQDPYLQELLGRIREAREKADVVFVCPHMGGQFNRVPGESCEKLMRTFVSAGADSVVASHPHVIQKVERIEEAACFYSLGNVSMSMNTVYILKANHPELGVVAHYYIEEKTICGISFSVTKIIEEPDGFLRVYALSDLYAKADEKEKKQLEQDFAYALSAMGIEGDYDITKEIKLK